MCILTHTHTRAYTHTHTDCCTVTRRHTAIYLERATRCTILLFSCRLVDGVLLAIGGTEDKEESKQTSAIYAFHPVDQKWQQVGDMPFKCSYVDTLLLSGGRLLVVDGYSQRVLRVTAEGKPCKFYGQYC